MKLSYAASAALAPAMALAAALAMPEPTQHFAVAADNWSPAPTLAPQFNIFARETQQTSQDNTCGYVSGLSASSITCPNSQICATNTFFGKHGCCDPSALSSCTIATTCIASSDMSASCTSDCSSNNAIAKCTQSTAAECYRYLFVYDSTTMTQHGCTASGFTLTVPRSYGPATTQSQNTIVVTKTEFIASTTPTSPSSPSSGGAAPPADKKQSLGPIVGGTIGACSILSIVALTAFLIHRRRTKAQHHQNLSAQPPVTQFPHNSPEFDARGFPVNANANGWSEQDIKTWQQSGGVWRPGAPGQYVGVSEVHGDDRAVEVEAPDKTKVGGWDGNAHETGHWSENGNEYAAVEVEAPTRREEKKKGGGSWRRPVEAPS